MPATVEALLAEALLADDPQRAVAAAAQRHPELGTALAAGFALLARGGLVATGKATAGEPFGRFRLLELLGGGGMGLVHRAEEVPLGRTVALKRIRPELLHCSESRQRFLREVAAIAALQHPSIVPVYGCGECEGVPWYAMQLVEGRSLASILDSVRQGTGPSGAALQRPGLAWSFACLEVVLQVAEALLHAHSRGILHRDVKPSNVMLADDGRALLIDFGLARIAGDGGVTRSGLQPGSLAYMSPEQVRGEVVDERTDIWSVGATLWELLTTVAPFAAPTEAETRRRILDADCQRGATSRRPFPADIAAVLATCLAPERERRYATMAALVADLRALLAHRPIAAKSPGWWLRCRRYAQRRPTMVTALGLGSLLLVSLPTALYLQERTARELLRQQASTAQAAVAFLEDLFAETTPERARGNTVTARVILDRGVQRVREELRAAPAVQVSLLEAMGAAYLGLGLFDAAGPLLHDAERLRDAGHGDGAARQRLMALQARVADARGDHARAERLWRSIGSACPPLAGPQGVARAVADLQLARALWRQDRVDEADALLQQSVRFLREHAAVEPVRLADALRFRGEFLLEREDALAAVPVLAEAEQRLGAALPEDHPERIAVRCDLARAHRITGAEAAAAELLARAEAAAAQVLDGQHPLLAAVREEQAALAIDFDRPFDAVGPLSGAVASYRAVYPAPHHVLARALVEECRLRTALGDLRGAAAVAEEAIAHYRLLCPDGSLDMAAAMSGLSFVQLQAGDLHQAIELARQSLAMQDRLRQRRTAIRALTAAHLGYALAFSGDFAAAQALVDEAVAAVTSVRVEPAVELRVRCYAVEVLCLQRQGQAAHAALAAMADTLLRSGAAWRSWHAFLRGWASEIERDHGEAETRLREALALREEAHGAQHPLCGIVLGELGVVLVNRGALAEAEQVLDRAVAIRRAHGGLHDVHVNLPLLNLATVRMLQRRFDTARADAELVVANLGGVAGTGHPVAIGAVRLLLRLSASIEDRDERARKLHDLQRFASTVVPADDPLRAALAAALAAASR